MKRRLGLLLCLFLVLAFAFAPRETKAAAYGISNPVTVNDVTTWDCIYFGNYYQSDATGTTKEQIKWRILSVDGDDAFLIADQSLDCQPYNAKYTDVSWATCTLRTWLNDTFLNTAFTSTEQSAILDTNVKNVANPIWDTAAGVNTTDKVYLLSRDEVENSNYGFDSEYLAKSKTREAKNTAYAKQCGAWTSTTIGYEGNGNWWLRTPGATTFHATQVVDNGSGDNSGVSVESGSDAVRPVLHLNLSLSLWTYAGKTNSNGEVESGVVPTPTPTTPIATSLPVTTLAPVPAPLVVAPVSVTPPAKVKLSTVKNKKSKKIICVYKKVSNVAGYEIQYATNKKFSKSKTKTSAKTSVTITKTKKGKTYYIRVRAYILDGKKKVYGKWSTVKRVQVKR